MSDNDKVSGFGPFALGYERVWTGKEVRLENPNPVQQAAFERAAIPSRETPSKTQPKLPEKSVEISNPEATPR